MKILVTITTGFTLVGGLASVMMNYYRVLTKTNLNIDFCCSNEPQQVLLEEKHAKGSEYYQLHFLMKYMPMVVNIINCLIAKMFWHISLH